MKRQPFDQLNDIRAAAEDYAAALRNREHGGVAAGNLAAQVLATLGIDWRKAPSQRVVEIGGGTLTFCLTGSPMHLGPDERKLVGTVMELIDAFEVKRSKPPSASPPEPSGVRA